MQTSRGKKYWAIWLLEDFVLGLAVDWGYKGSLRYWREMKRYDNGDVLIQRGRDRSILFADELKTGEKHREPDFSFPTGLHFGFKYIGNINWIKRKINEHKGLPPPKQEVEHE